MFTEKTDARRAMLGVSLEDKIALAAEWQERARFLRPTTDLKAICADVGRCYRAVVKACHGITGPSAARPKKVRSAPTTERKPRSKAVYVRRPRLPGQSLGQLLAFDRSMREPAPITLPHISILEREAA